MPDGSNLILGSEADPAWKANNTSDATTRVERNGGAVVTALVVENLNGAAIQGDAGAGTSAGVVGMSGGGPGLRGRSQYAMGVQGISNADVGVVGRGSTAGVHGKSDRLGVEGEGAIGVLGEGGNIGVFGDARGGTGVFGMGRVGVTGVSTAAQGVQGNSSTGIGVNGDSDVIGVAGTAFGKDQFAAGVRGVSRQDRMGVQGRSDRAVVFRSGLSFGAVGAGVLAESPAGTGLLARTGSPNGLAGMFMGDVAIGGNVFVIGSVTATGGKAASVAHPDGSQRLTFALECPEAFFEDFGQGRVVGGRARVEIDADFAALVDRAEYFVFVTPEGESQGLYVSKKSRDFFEVREQQRGTSTLAFSYRLVARRKDLPRRRLPKGVVREVHTVDLPPVEATPQDGPRLRRAPRPPHPLRELARLAAAKARPAPRGKKGAKRKKKR